MSFYKTELGFANTGLSGMITSPVTPKLFKKSKSVSRKTHSGEVLKGLGHQMD